MKYVTVIVTLISIVAANNCNSQTYQTPFKNNSIDTSKIIAKICTHGLPNQKKNATIDYQQFVCAYIYKNDSLKSFRVLSYDFIDLNPKSPKEIHVPGNSIGPIKVYLLNQDSVSVRNLFLANIILEDQNKKIVLRGLRPLLGPK
jgi:hypothetical protein